MENKTYSNLNKGCGWIKQSQKGTSYISCKMNIDGKDYNFSIFKNERKTSEKSPDYNILLSTGKPSNQGNNAFKDDSDSSIPF